MSKLIFEGTLIGRVIKVPNGVLPFGGIVTSFVIQLKDQIEGLPKEIPVYAKQGMKDRDY